MTINGRRARRHYRQTIRSGRRPDVEVQAILVAAAGLRALAGISGGIHRVAPGHRRLGRRPADNAADGPVVRLHGRAWVAAVVRQRTRNAADEAAKAIRRPELGEPPILVGLR